MPFIDVIGLPGVRAPRTASYRKILWSGEYTFLAGGALIDGTLSRDPGNTGNVNVLRAGLLLGKITSSKKYAPSILGTTNGAYSTGTTLTVAAGVGTEIVRRFGASGTFNLTGPATASGTNRTLTITYSAATDTVVTITDPNVNEVQTLNFANSPVGTFTLTVTDPTGVDVDTAPITYSGTAATLVSNINSALNTALGSTLVVASGSAVTAIALTFSGAGYLAKPQSMVRVGSNELTAGTVSVSRTTTGVAAAFITGSLVQPADGSQTAVTFISEMDGWSIVVVDVLGNSTDVEFARLPIAGSIDESQLINWPTDSSLRSYLIGQLNGADGGQFVFNARYTG